MPEYLYSDPISRLLTIGSPFKIPDNRDWQSGPNWLDYPADFGFNAGHIPELIRMATDEEFNLALEESTEIWAPMHAWRALGQLGAAEAVPPLLGLFHLIDDEDNEWVSEDLPEVMGLIGAAAIPPVSKYMADIENKLWARISAAISLEKIATAHPSSRQECINALTTVLENFARNDVMLNGELVGCLAELDAVEAAPLVEQAYKADRVDESINGDWEDFQVEVGLLEERITDPDLDFNPFFPSLNGEMQQRSVRKDSKQAKKKRKQSKESRKKNRKKKKK